MTQLIDPFKRQISYLRLSVTDRCNLRCRYCMAEDMTFLPKQQILTLEETFFIAQAFAQLGLKKIRLTGGEPLVRHNLLWLVERLCRIPGLQEVALTTNGVYLPKHAQRLVDTGVKRINISLDSLDAEGFNELTRTGNLTEVLAGIQAAKQAGARVKLNAVILQGYNEDQILPLVRYALDEGLDISFIEEMPLGQVTDHSRADCFISSEKIREQIQAQFALEADAGVEDTLGGPARYWRIAGYSNRIGFISPHSENFCASCNRVRMTAEGKLLLCLGHDNAVDLRALVRRYPGDIEVIKSAILASLSNKPEKHDFTLDDEPQIVRFMNMTGG